MKVAGGSRVALGIGLGTVVLVLVGTTGEGTTVAGWPGPAQAVMASIMAAMANTANKLGIRFNNIERECRAIDLLSNPVRRAGAQRQPG